ncbi:MAG: SUKH-3 domain-containing protein [Ruminococcus flavefaciens]|nr:SUKH-3 domain-containing protein [Ruminococcus flavefaciens]
MLTEIAKQQLMKAGWYEGRKIDVSNYEKRFTELGYEFFPAARRFLEEFGDLHIVDRLNWDYIKPGRIGINDSSTKLERMVLLPMADCGDFIEKVGKKVIPVAMIDYENIQIYISEDGKFYEGINAYSEGGLRAENSEQLWNEYYGTEEAGWASWEDLKAGKGRTMHKNNYSGQIYL